MTSKDKRKIAYGISLISQIGISMMVPIFLCTWLGIYVSNKVNMDILVLLFIFLGVGAAFRNVYLLTKKIYSKDKSKEDELNRYFDDMKKEREERLGHNDKIS